MGNYFGVPLLILAALLQVTVIPQINILGGEPNLVMLLVITYAIQAPLEQGVAWAFVGGILQDLLTSLPLGATTLALLIVVFVIDRLRGQLVRLGFFSIIGVTILATVLLQVIALTLTILAGYNIRLFEMITYNIVPSIAYNLVFVFPTYWLMRRFCPPPLRVE
jgi:rod shape-determining protein MreD